MSSGETVRRQIYPVQWGLKGLTRKQLDSVLIQQFGRVLPTRRLPMLAEDFEDQIEELH